MGGWIDGGGGVLYPLIGLSDTDSSNWLTLDWGENDTSDRTLNFYVGGGNRTLTINGNATLNDWFDQSVKTSASPTFTAVTLKGTGSYNTTIQAGGASASKTYTWPLTDGSSGQALTTNASGVLSWATPVGTYTDAAARLTISSSATGLTYTNTTGVFTLTAGYFIPTATPTFTTVTFGTIYANGNSGGTKTIDWNNGQKQSIVLTGSPGCTFTFTAPTGGVGNFLLKCIQGSGGSKTATWPGTITKWPAGTAPTLSTAESAVDIISFFYDGTNYYGSSSLNFS
jgi:hypothetical protein